MDIRYAKESDESQILALLDQLISEVNLRGGFTKSTEGETPRRKIFKEMMARKDTIMIVAEEKGKLLGFVDFFIMPIVRRGYYNVHIEDFVVDESARGKGVGTAILKKVVSLCKEKGFKVVKLDSGLELTSAHKFYEKNGFKFTEKMFRLDII